MLDLVPKKLFLTKGKGVHEDRLTSFEYALRDAGIAGTNIVLISSIFPPHAKLISRTEGLKQIKPGQILFTIYSRNQTNEPHRMCSASVGIARPKDPNRYGYLSEYESYGQNQNQAGDYAEIACNALKEMHRQVGDLVTDHAGIAQRGLIIRHLVLPGGVAGTREIMRFIAREISTRSYVNIMAQYRPCGRAAEIKELSTFLSPADYRRALQDAAEEGITRLDQPRRYFVLK